MVFTSCSVPGRVLGGRGVLAEGGNFSPRGLEECVELRGTNLWSTSLTGKHQVLQASKFGRTRHRKMRQQNPATTRPGGAVHEFEAMQVCRIRFWGAVQTKRHIVAGPQQEIAVSVGSRAKTHV